MGIFLFIVAGAGSVQADIWAWEADPKAAGQLDEVTENLSILCAFPSFLWPCVPANRNCPPSAAAGGIQCAGIRVPAAAGAGDPRGELAARAVLCVHAGGVPG